MHLDIYFNRSPSGFFVENVPSFFSWVKYLSPFKYAYDGCLYFEFDGRRVPCDGSGMLEECAGQSSGSVDGDDIINDLGATVGLLFFNGVHYFDDAYVCSF